MEKIENKQGFKILNLSKEESMKLNFGFLEKGEHICVCMSCNEDCKDSINYIPVMSDVMCDNCLKEWLEDPYTKKYSEDDSFEDYSYNFVVEKLKQN